MHFSSMSMRIATAVLAASSTISTIVASPVTYNNLTAPQISKIIARNNRKGREKASTLPVELVIHNNESPGVAVYITGEKNDQTVFLSPGSRNWEGFAPHAKRSQKTAPVKVSQEMAIRLGDKGGTDTIMIPSHIISSRIRFSDRPLHFFTNSGNGKMHLVEASVANPDDTNNYANWAFVEFTYNEREIFANPTNVDFVGMRVSKVRLSCTGEKTRTIELLDKDPVKKVCKGLREQAKLDKAAGIDSSWDKLCIQNEAGEDFRVLAPNDYQGRDKHAFANYWTKYIDEIYEYYSYNTLFIDTQKAEFGVLACRVRNNTLYCDGDPRGMPKPTGPNAAMDIFGCDTGAFAISPTDTKQHVAVVPRVCAAIHRGTLLVPGGDLQPGLDETHYYNTSTVNHYSRIVHEHLIEKKGYAFAYDDVHAFGGHDPSGALSCPNPERLEIWIGDSDTD